MKTQSAFTVFAVFVLLAAASAQAQWPSRPVQIIVPNAPGGGPDLIARLLAPRLADTIKQSVVVDNRASNNGITGAEFGAARIPDGDPRTVFMPGPHITRCRRS